MFLGASVTIWDILSKQELSRYNLPTEEDLAISLTYSLVANQPGAHVYDTKNWEETRLKLGVANP
jgi:hypothetical protein